MPLMLPMPLMPLMPLMLLMLLCCRCQPPTIMCHWPRWLAIAATAYAKSNGYFPDPTTALTYKDWGGLAQLGFNEYISNERAIIMIAHVHALTISACAAFGPQVLGDTLTLLDGEEDEVRRPLTIRTCPPWYTTPQHATRHEPVDRSQANHSAGAPIGNGCRVVG